MVDCATVSDVVKALEQENKILRTRLDKLSEADVKKRASFSEELHARIARIRVPHSEEEHFRRFLRLIVQVEDNVLQTSAVRSPSPSPLRPPRSTTPTSVRSPSTVSSESVMVSTLQQELVRARGRIRDLSAEVKRERGEVALHYTA